MINGFRNRRISVHRNETVVHEKTDPVLCSVFGCERVSPNALLSSCPLPIRLLLPRPNPSLRVRRIRLRTCRPTIWLNHSL